MAESNMNDVFVLRESPGQSDLVVLPYDFGSPISDIEMCGSPDSYLASSPLSDQDSTEAPHSYNGTTDSDYLSDYNEFETMKPMDAIMPGATDEEETSEPAPDASNAPDVPDTPDVPESAEFEETPTRRTRTRPRRFAVTEPACYTAPQSYRTRDSANRKTQAKHRGFHSKLSRGEMVNKMAQKHSKTMNIFGEIRLNSLSDNEFLDTMHNVEELLTEERVAPVAKRERRKKNAKASKISRLRKKIVVGMLQYYYENALSAIDQVKNEYEAMKLRFDALAAETGHIANVRSIEDLAASLPEHRFPSHKVHRTTNRSLSHR